MFYLGRQSILDRSQNLYAFELLFRSSTRNAAEVLDDVTATATVINYVLNELGIESVLGGYKGFINLSRALLMSDTIELLPRDKVVLEILETVDVTPEVIERCRALRKAGFTLALDDFVSHEARFEPMLELAHIVKVDLQQVGGPELAALVDTLRGSNVQLLAEKVDTAQQVRRCMDLGFELFQGYHFARPEIITGRRLSHSKAILMRILAKVVSDFDVRDIEHAMKGDPALMVSLLRLINSVAANPGRHISSISVALMYLGHRQVQRWLLLMLFAGLAPNAAFPSPLMQLAATRGKLLEILAAGDKSLEDKAYMAGIMSLIETFLGMPMAEIIAPLSLPDEVASALLERRGTLGKLLDLAEALEGHAPEVVRACLSRLPGLSVQQINAAQVQALRWANTIREASG